MPQLRQALRTENETLLRRAAETLGILHAKDAVKDLISSLVRAKQKTVMIPPPDYFAWLRSQYQYSRLPRGALIPTASYEPPAPGLDPAVSMFGYLAPTYEQRWVNEYRTEVLEALKQIPGRNFGFEIDEWRNWYQKEFVP